MYRNGFCKKNIWSPHIRMTDLYFQTFSCNLSPQIIWIFITCHCLCWSGISFFRFYSRYYLVCFRFSFFFQIWLHGKRLFCFKLYLDILLNLTLSPWCGDYHYCTTSFNRAWIQLLCRFISCSRHIREMRWWEFLAVVPAGNKA